MTSQQVYDRIVTHLREQGCRSTHVVKYWGREEVESAYRGDDDRKCAGGCLLDDKEYIKDMEGVTFGSFLKLDSSPKTLKDKYLSHVDLIDSLNFIHDWFEPAEWEEGFMDTAVSYKLKYTKPEVVEAEETG